MMDIERTMMMVLVGLSVVGSVPAADRPVPPLVPAAGNRDRPNFLFILADDQRNDTLGCAGHPHIKSPIIDSLAEQGLRFRNAFVTTSICMASRANIFTGLTTTGHGYKGNPPISVLPCDVDTSFPTLLRKAGYQTAFYGKQHVRFQEGNEKAMSRMFDSWEKIFRRPYFKTMPDGARRHTAELIGDRSREFIAGLSPSQPFCLYMSFNIAHAEDRDRRPGIGHFPWPKKEDGLYEDITPPPPTLDAPEYFDTLPDFLKNSMNRARWYWRWDTEEKYRINMRAYWRMITGMDRIIGTVIAKLKKRGLYENTVVIYTADNGYYMGDRGFAGKWSHFEESLRVPMIIYDPRLKAGKKSTTSDRIALSIDIPATILDMAGIPIPEKYQGRSLTSLLQNPEATSWRKEYFAEFHRGGNLPSWYGIRHERHVYARYYEENREFLHDLTKDPTQLQNYANDPEYAEALAQMRSRTDEYIQEYTRPEVAAEQAKKRGRRAGQASGTSKKASRGRGPSADAAPSGRVKQHSVGPYKGGTVDFKGDSALLLANVPELGPEDSYTWACKIEILPGNARGAVLLGNRKNPKRNYNSFMKFTAGKGIQVFNNTKKIRLACAVPADKMSTLALVKDKDRLLFYLEGKKLAETKIDFAIDAMPCYVGGDPAAPNEMATCKLHAANVWARALSHGEIMAFMLGKETNSE